MGRNEGTLFMPQDEHLCRRKHWIAFTKFPKGDIVIDHGAEKALIERGKSLLPSGIHGVKGNFSMGDSVILRNLNGDGLAVGLVNYQSGDIRKIKGCKSNEIESRLGYKHDDEVIHRDNLVLTKDLEEYENLGASPRLECWNTGIME